MGILDGVINVFKLHGDDTMMTNMMITMNTMKKTRKTKVRQERNFLVEAKSMMMMQMMTIHQ